MANGPIQVNSEIGKLKTVLLKRPGKELENLVPDYLDGLLFDDIPYLKVAQQEHDRFAKVLQDEGVEVLYLEQLAAESIEDSNIREQFINDVLAESRKTILGHEKEIKKLFSTLSNQELINKVMAGVRKEEIKLESTHLVEYMDDKYPFYLDPMPNLYFTRDPQASVGRGMTVNRMFWRARRRESIFISYILKYHPRFKDADVPVWLDRECPFNIEGETNSYFLKMSLQSEFQNVRQLKPSNVWHDVFSKIHYQLSKSRSDRNSNKSYIHAFRYSMYYD